MTQHFDTSFDDLLGSSKTVQRVPAPSDLRVSGGAGTKELAMAGDAYEGASLRSREMAMWQPATRSADGDILPHKKMSDARVRDTLRNDSYVNSGARLHQDNMVGGMYMLNAKPATRILLGENDEVWEEEFQEETEERFTLWAESTDNWIDASRRNNFTMQVRQAVGSYLSTGEILASVEWLRDSSALRPFNTAIRMIDLDRLSTPMDRLGDPLIIAGVEVDSRHVPVAYHIRNAHPSDHFRTEAFKWTRIEARKPWGRPQMIHMFDQLRPGQTRGISDMVTALKEMRQTKDFREVVLQNAVVNATYAATIESDLDTSSIFQRMGGGNLGEGAGGEDPNELIGGYMTAYLGAVAKYVGDSKQFQLGGVRIPHLPPGSKLNLHPAGQGGPLGTEFEQSLLRYIASNLGVSYEQLSRDYTQTNYSSARAAMTETWKFMQSRKKLVADRFATYIYRLWLEEILNKGGIESMPTRMKSDTGWLYQPLALDAVSRCEWVGASRGQIDELKETQAAVLRLKYNLTTLEDEQARLGKDWRSGIRQQKREREKLKAADLLPPEDNMVNAIAGTKSASEAKSEKKSSATKPKATGGNLNGTLAQDFTDAEHENADERGSKNVSK